MKLSDKIIRLRKSNGMSQEELADKLNISRQAISRWEIGSAMPDATNILKISKLFKVTTDYLLNDDYKEEDNLPKTKEIKEKGFKQLLILMVTLEIMILFIQLITTFILQNTFFSFMSFIPFVALIGGFEYAYHEKLEDRNEKIVNFRKRFYTISTWLGLYFPSRLLISTLIRLYPRPYSSLVLELVVLSVYVLISLTITLFIRKKSID